jgi:hypothetical protein
VFAPPLVVNSPAVLDGFDGAWSEAALTPEGDDISAGVGLDLKRAGRIQWPQIVAADSGWPGRA